jgi:hypothetical protein
MKVYGGMKVQIHSFLSMALDGGEWVVSGPGCFTPGKGALRTHWIGGWEDPKTYWMIWRTENLLLLPRIKPRYLTYQAHSLVNTPTELSQP